MAWTYRGRGNRGGRDDAKEKGQASGMQKKKRLTRKRGQNTQEGKKKKKIRELIPTSERVGLPVTEETGSRNGDVAERKHQEPQPLFGFKRRFERDLRTEREKLLREMTIRQGVDAGRKDNTPSSQSNREEQLGGTF